MLRRPATAVVAAAPVPSLRPPLVGAATTPLTPFGRIAVHFESTIYIAVEEKPEDGNINVSVLLFGDGFVVIPRTPEGLQIKFRPRD